MAAESWHAARLIPTSDVGGVEERQRRSVSALLAVLAAVPEFGAAFSEVLGAPCGRVESFVDVPFRVGEAVFVPGGLIRITRGACRWTALVEVKTGADVIPADRLGTCLSLAREQGFDAVLTVSNEVPAVPAPPLSTVDEARRLQISWSQLLCKAVAVRAAVNAERAWILGELIGYLEHPNSGTVAFDDMGEAWEPARAALAAGTLRAEDNAATEVAARFDELLRFASLRLGVEATPALSRKESVDPLLRTRTLAERLAEDGSLAGAIRIPGSAALLHVKADLRADRLACYVDMDVPREGRPTTRVNWVERQIRNAPSSVRVEQQRELRAFRISQDFAMGTGRAGFVGSVLSAVTAFYADVVQNLRKRAAPVPRMRSGEAVAGAL
ncbi:hypothetical protein [Allokutzneria sp. NRRL B-24872]|uniref:hypothetical protein n=1 Tax=Allokutzneria sp. NRRL B-24872 TaxID=1137961 RepID=UPI000A3C99A1|nr:hypothetical protein [Allokutzneria sp. NRRL B-24872]